MRDHTCDMLILDEVLVALDYALIQEEQILALIDAKPPEMELVLTGRGAPQTILDKADLATEMKEIKHPYQKGIQAREGVEF
jgi:cob(I)alamin adenosyltransferase